jgi:hypothetical protein
MHVLGVGTKLIPRKFSTDLKCSRRQNLFEIVVAAIKIQISDVGLNQTGKWMSKLIDG